MSRKAVFAVVSHLSRRGSSLLHVSANITNETYLFLVITIAADGKLTAVADSDCEKTTTAPDDDNACRQWRGRQLAVGGGGNRDEITTTFDDDDDDR